MSIGAVIEAADQIDNAACRKTAYVSHADVVCINSGEAGCISVT